MRPIVLDEAEKEKMFRKFAEKFLKALNEYTFGSSKEITFTEKIGEKLKEKIIISFTPKAYLRMKALVDEYDSEVSWFGLVDKKSDMLYRVYDVLVCRQQVNGAKVDTRDEDMLEFISGLTDEQSDHMLFQAHSHVNMSTMASGTDLQNQDDILAGKPGNEGFYIFQIWNKKGDINTYLYDMDNNRFYDRDDVQIEIEDEQYGSLDGFILSTKDLVERMKPAYYAGTYPATPSYGTQTSYATGHNNYAKGSWDGYYYSRGGVSYGEEDEEDEYEVSINPSQKKWDF